MEIAEQIGGIMFQEVEKVERLISEINKLHTKFFEDFFNSGIISTNNLALPIHRVPKEHILSYRLNLHESINDYLYRADVKDINFYYRVKTGESILDKIERYQARQTNYPVNNILNDIFGARMILNSDDIALIISKLDDWKEQYGLKNWYLRDVDGYVGIHIYFKNAYNFYYPWELQLWDEKDAESNIESHLKYKRNFVK